MRKILILVLMLISTVCAFGYQGGFNKRSAKQLDQLLNERYDAKTPGCVILVAENDKIVFEKAYGSANIELGVPMKTDMVFRIGSITKEFTSVAILQLVERGVIYVNLITNRVDGYSCWEGRCMNVDYISMSTVYSAGALLSNVYDLFS